MSDVLNALAADAAAAYTGSTPYTYAAQDALTARILILEEGGAAFPKGVDIGQHPLDAAGKWDSILAEAAYQPGMFSWWNAIPCGLDRTSTADDRGRGGSFLRRAIALHSDLHVIIAVGTVAQGIAKTSRTNLNIVGTRSPLRANDTERQKIVDAFVQARLYGYPLGF